MSAADLTFLYGESVPRCAHRIDKHFDGYATLQYMDAGAVQLNVGERKFELEGRWFWSAYPGPRIAFRAADGHAHWRHRYLAFSGARLDRWADERLFPIDPQPAPAGGAPPAAPPASSASLRFDRPHAFAERFDALLAHALSHDRWGALRATHLLEEILIDLAEARAATQPTPAWLKATLQRLDRAARGDEPVDYDDVAATVGMAQSTLRRRFRAATGLPPHEYVLQSRVAEARRLLGETDLPIKAIAARLGYRDVYFFSRQFRALAGASPALYRKSRQG